MQPDPRVLVVGTTTDYIHWIRQSCPGECLFLTDPRLRGSAMEPPPHPEEEVLCDLSDYNGLRSALGRHLAAYHQDLTGVACFDCESMILASLLAGDFSLPYPAVKAVGNCRNKYLAKRLWQAHQLDTTPVMQVGSAEEAVRFQQVLGSPIVLKPLCGSGSELIFICTDSESCAFNFRQIRNGLRRRGNHRLYASFSADDPGILAEGMIGGEEYSCDFIVQDGRADIIRLTHKIHASQGPFGTTQGYVLITDPPGGIENRQLHQILFESAAALGIRRAICMLDFIVDRGRMVLLELAPRPGGDCLPFLLRQAYHLDMLKLQLDFARNEPLVLQRRMNGASMVGLRVHARRSGILKHIDSSRLKADARVREIVLTRQPGHRIVLPPEDYDAWLMGHVIFEPEQGIAIETQCNALLGHIEISVE